MRTFSLQLNPGGEQCMDVRLPVDPAARRFEREHAEAVRHKPHVLAPDGLAADVASEAEGHIGRPKGRDPRNEKRGRSPNPFQGTQMTSRSSELDSGSDESGGEHHVLDVRV